MTDHTVYGYFGSSFYLTPNGQFILDPNFDTGTDAIRFEISEPDGDLQFHNDDTDPGGGGDQTGTVYDAGGAPLGSGVFDVPYVVVLTDGLGNSINLYQVDLDGAGSGWVADGIITPGTAYDYTPHTAVTAGSAPLYSALVAPTDDPDDANTYHGGIYDDFFSPGALDDTVYGYGGADQMMLGAGDDLAFGGDDGDTISGGDGLDTLYGNAGNDALLGDAGPDLIDGGTGDDTLSGGTGDDTLYGEDDNDSLDGGDGNDSLFGGAGADTLYGDADHDTLWGGTGDDHLDGGTGDDVLYGQDGNDRIRGGTGNDTVTGGLGEDTIVQAQNGSTVITDFDLGDTDANGFYNDQLDISELRTPDGRSIHAWDVVVTDDGSGNAVLTFPEGETITLMGVSPAQMSSPAQLQAAGIPCFVAGTQVAAARGVAPVECLRVGDRVQTRDNGLRPVRWIATRSIPPPVLARMPILRPVHIAPGTFGNVRPLRLSSQHALALEAGDGKAQLVRAGHLARMRGGAVRVANGMQGVTYVHLLLDSHDLIMAEGVACESFYPGAWGLCAVGLSAMRELARLMPALWSGSVERVYGPRAHPMAAFGGLPADLRDLSVAH